jgi:hypothetical protein
VGGESAFIPVPCSIAPESLTGIFRPIVPNAAESAGPKIAEFLAVWAYSVRGYTSPSRWPCDHFLHVSRTAAALSVEGSRLARRPPRKRRVAAFTPRSETTIETGLNSSKRDDIQTMDRHVFRVVVLRRNGTENRVKQMAHFVPNRCRSISRVWAYNVSVLFFSFRELAGSPNRLPATPD